MQLKVRSASMTVIAAVTMMLGISGCSKYETGFETPIFHLGQLAGQDGWIALQNVSVNAAQVSPSGGMQNVKITGTAIEQFSPGFYSGFFQHAAPSVTTNSNMRISADYRLQRGPSAPTAQYLFAFLRGLDENGHHIGTIGLDGLDVIFGQNFASPNQVVRAVPKGNGQFHNLQVDVNFVSRTMTYFVDGTNIGVLPFNSATGNRLKTVDLVLQSSGPSDSVLEVDNVKIETIPTLTFPAPYTDVWKD